MNHKGEKEHNGNDKQLQKNKRINETQRTRSTTTTRRYSPLLLREQKHNDRNDKSYARKNPEKPSYWEEIIFNKEETAIVKKICYKNWGLEENGTKQK